MISIDFVYNLAKKMEVRLSPIVFFCNDTLANYMDCFEKIIFIIKDDKENKAQGCAFCIEHSGYVVVYPNEVLKATKAKFNFLSYKKSLLFTILHEIGHIKQCLDIFKNGKYKNIEECFVESNEKIRLFIEKNKDKDKIEISRMTEEEILADQFAFNNLHYFENLYNFEGILV